MPLVKKEVDFNFDIIVRCHECGEDLNIKSEEVDGWGDVITTVEPCDCQLEERGE